jgi:hypothetical protein
MANRLPNVFISRRHAGERIFTDQIDRLARGLDQAGALAFPEGGDWTPGRWLRGIRRLEQLGRGDLPARARNTWITETRPSGAQALALSPGPAAD